MCAMRYPRLLELRPSFYQHLRLSVSAEPRPVKRFVAQLAVEVFYESATDIRVEWHEHRICDAHALAETANKNSSVIHACPYH